MSSAKQPSDPAVSAEDLARLAEMLGLEIPPETLASLSTQLGVVEALEQAKLQDHPPILKMDADWHD